jgi:hypothetical protein
MKTSSFKKAVQLHIVCFDISNLQQAQAERLPILCFSLALQMQIKTGKVALAWSGSLNGHSWLFAVS